MIQRTVNTCVTLLCIVILSHTGFAAEVFTIPYSETVDITHTDKVFHLDGMDITVSMSRPAKAFKKIQFSFVFKASGKAIFPEKTGVRFNMKMDMGDYHTDLTRNSGTFSAQNIMLPKCMSGGKRWYGKLYFTVQGKEYSLVFLFDLQ